MTIEDAIKHCRDTALSNAGNAIAYLKGGQKMLAESCEKCAAEHEQLAKWLEELKQRRKAEPVRHGRWIVKILPIGGGDKIRAYLCSECDRYTNMKFDFCPNCGARMDGGEGNDS